MFSLLEPKVFASNDYSEVAAHIDREGYCVVRIDSIDLDHLHRLFEQDMSKIVGRDIKFPELWEAEIPNSSLPGLMGEYGLSQGDSAWYVRTNPDIIRLYEHLLGTNKVVCSMDAVGFSQDNDPVSKDLWLHVDQNPNIYGSDTKSIQAIFYAEDCFGERAGTVIVPRSHRDHMHHIYRSKGHFQIVEQERYAHAACKLNIPAGCLVLFSSKLVHQGMFGPHRLCFMVCYGRECDRSEEARRGKVVMYLGGHRGNHWSQFAMYHGWKWQHGSPWEMLVPRTLGSSQVAEELCDSEVTDLGLYSPTMDQIIPPERLALL